MIHKLIAVQMSQAPHNRGFGDGRRLNLGSLKEKDQLMNVKWDLQCYSDFAFVLCLINCEHMGDDQAVA